MRTGSGRCPSSERFTTDQWQLSGEGIDQWSAESKLAVVVETMLLSELELSQYCREKGLHSEQVNTWKSECLSGFQVSAEQRKQVTRQAQSDKAEIKGLKRDLRIKEKALAETAALLVLRKKLHALWGEESEVK